METKEIEDMILAGIPGSQVTVTGDGSHFDAIIISDEFDGLSPIKKQQLVYGTLGDSITSGRLHAFSMQNFTTDEWAAKGN